MTDETVTGAEDVFDVGDHIEDVDLESLEASGGVSGGTILQVKFDMGFQAYRRERSPRQNFVSAMSIGQQAASRAVTAIHNEGLLDGTYTKQDKEKPHTPQLCLILDGNSILNGELKSSWGNDTGLRYVTLPMYPERENQVSKSDYVPRAYQQVKLDAIEPIAEMFDLKKTGHVFGNTYWLRLVWVHDPFVVNEIVRDLHGKEVFIKWQNYGDLLREFAEAQFEETAEPIDFSRNDLGEWVVDTLTEMASDDNTVKFDYWVPKILQVYKDEDEARGDAGDFAAAKTSTPDIPEGWDDEQFGPWQVNFALLVDLLGNEEGIGVVVDLFQTAFGEPKTTVDVDGKPESVYGVLGGDGLPLTPLTDKYIKDAQIIVDDEEIPF